MILPFSLYALLAVLTVYSEASSKLSRPIKRIVHPQTHAIDIFPRNNPLTKRDSGLRFDDSFRLSLSAFEETFHLHLTPNDDLIHPQARITYHETDPKTGRVSQKVVPLVRETVKVYEGHVIHPDHTDARKLEDIAGVVDSSFPALGWARIMVHDEGNPAEGRLPVFEGSFSVNGDIHHIVTKDEYLRLKQTMDAELVEELEDLQLVVWRQSDVMSAEEHHFMQTGEPLPPAVQSTCGLDTLEYNTSPALNPALRATYESSVLPYPLSPFWRRQDINGEVQNNFAGSIGQYDGCPTSQKLMYMGVAADCVYVSKYGSQGNATQKILNDWNSATALYKSTFKVSLGIIEVQVQGPNCPSQADPTMAWNIDCSGDGADINNRLSLFSKWRGDKSKSGEDGAGLWHLMSGCPTGQQVGVAWLSTLCKTDAAAKDNGQFVSGVGVSTFGLTEWQVVAHEIGHNFGAIHDCTKDACSSAPQSCCPMATNACDTESKYIMSPTSTQGEHVFSPCTIGNICSLMKAAENPTDQKCLLDATTATRTLFSLKMCGNGIVEDGEDCDPGSGASSPCCDSKTCKFTSGSQCDPLSSLCCTDQCKFASSDKVCRPSKDSLCDIEEKCSGTTGTCPGDAVKPNGQSCGDGDLKCASGFCTSVAKQCAAQGASMNITQGCKQAQTTCELVCQDPKSDNSCIKLSSLLVDGSPCGYAGTCSNGKCKAGPWTEVFMAWYKKNLQIAIPVTIAAALVAVLILYCIFSCLCGARRGAKPTYMVVTPNAPPTAPSYNHGYNQGYSGAGPYQRMQG